MKTFVCLLAVVSLTFCAGIAQADVFSMGEGITSLEFVPVGNPGNAADTRYPEIYGEGGVGSVGYVYRIATYEVTVAQYVEFLNAVAKTDTYGLYHTNMNKSGTGYTPKIARSGDPGSYVYTMTQPARANRPIMFASLWDAARFANWLHNGQPTGDQGPGTTEDGAYLGIGNLSIFARQAGAKYYLPSENEWHKAAYFDPTLNDGAGDYWFYPTQSNDKPSNYVTDPDGGNNANYKDGTRMCIGEPYVLTEVGEFEDSASYYGTFDQAGNTFEMLDTIDPLDATKILARGGSAGNNEVFMQAIQRHRVLPDSAETYYSIGFRIAAPIPEPGTLALLAAGLIGLLAHAWRKRK